MNKRYLSMLVIAGSGLWAAGALAAEDGEWHSLFNGKDLSGWTVKINKHPLGENYADTFRVEDGVIKVSLRPLREVRRAVRPPVLQPGLLQLHPAPRIPASPARAVADSPPWAKLNSGVMIHSQSPMSMGLNQAWPASMEFQFLSRGRHRGPADRATSARPAPISR